MLTDKVKTSHRFFQMWNWIRDFSFIHASARFKSGSIICVVYSNLDPNLHNSNFRFSYVNIGYTGRVHDAGVFRASALNQKIEEGLFPPKYHIIADGAFPLSEYVIKPFPGVQVGTREHFNYR